MLPLVVIALPLYSARSRSTPFVIEPLSSLDAATRQHRVAEACRFDARCHHVVRQFIHNNNNNKISTSRLLDFWCLPKLEEKRSKSSQPTPPPTHELVQTFFRSTTREEWTTFACPCGCEDTAIKTQFRLSVSGPPLEQKLRTEVCCYKLSFDFQFLVRRWRRN